jgi:hypothetical protein
MGRGRGGRGLLGRVEGIRRRELVFVKKPSSSETDFWSNPVNKSPKNPSFVLLVRDSR